MTPWKLLVGAVFLLPAIGYTQIYWGTAIITVPTKTFAVVAADSLGSEFRTKEMKDCARFHLRVKMRSRPPRGWLRTVSSFSQMLERER